MITLSILDKELKRTAKIMIQQDILYFKKEFQVLIIKQSIRSDRFSLKDVFMFIVMSPLIKLIEDFSKILYYS